MRYIAALSPGYPDLAGKAHRFPAVLMQHGRPVKSLRQTRMRELVSQGQSLAASLHGLVRIAQSHKAMGHIAEGQHASVQPHITG